MTYRRKTTKPSEDTASTTTSASDAPIIPLEDLLAAIERHKQEKEEEQKKKEELALANSTVEIYFNRNNFLLNTGTILGTVGKLFPKEIPGVPLGTSLEGLNARIAMTESQFARLGGRVEEVRSASGKTHRGILDTGFKVSLQGDDFCITPDLQEPGLLWLQLSCIKILSSAPWAGATPVSASAEEIASAIQLAREGTQKALAARRQRMMQEQTQAQQQMDFGSVNLE